MGSQAEPGSMRRWEREVTEAFLTWRHEGTRRGEVRLQSMCAAVSGTVRDYVAGGRVSAEEVTRRLPDALAACDALDFSEGVCDVGCVRWVETDHWRVLTPSRRSSLIWFLLWIGSRG